MSDRLDHARDLLAATGVDCLLVTNPADVRYLSGFRGDDAALLVSRAAALLCTDSRYWAQVHEEVTAFELEKTERLLPDAIAAATRLLGSGAALGFQGSQLSYAEHRLVRRRWGGRLRDVKAAVSGLRVVKDAAEQQTLRRACEVADAALRSVVSGGLAGRTERAVAWDLVAELHRLGAEGEAFPAIVAAGANGAKAHAIPGERRIVAGDLVVIDMGARVDGYCSDITRTYAVGELDGERRRGDEVVLAAQLAGLAAVRPGIAAREVDAAARAVIDEAGYGSFFGHGTGHGVGLEVHEDPRVSRASRDVVAEGMVFSVEPGIYLEGTAGVRIEDTVLVTASGGEPLTRTPKELTLVD